MCIMPWWAELLGMLCLSFIQSVCYTIFAAQAERYALKLAMQVQLDIISVLK